MIAPMSKQEFPIVERLGGREAVVQRLREAGHSRITKSAARMWVARRRLPGSIVAALMGFADVDELPYSAVDFKIPPTVAAGAELSAHP